MTVVQPSTAPSSPDAHVVNLAECEFAKFYRTTATRTFRIARRVAGGNDDVAREATQEAYARVLRRWDTLRRDEAAELQAYVARAAVNLVMDHYRRQQRLSELFDEHGGGVDDANLAGVLDEMTTLRWVREFIDRQPVRSRAVAVLLFLEHHNVGEIAEILGIAPSTVRTHVQRLRVRLKPFLMELMETTKGGELP
jgi:RNA polymerase sigma factor (sigma-70 family)